MIRSLKQTTQKLVLLCSGYETRYITSEKG